MAEPVDWGMGAPRSERYADVYHSEAGARAQALQVFLAGCGLPHAWADAAQWRILETGFGLGISFLTTWAAWREDPRRPGRLHFVSVEAHPVAPEDLRRAALREPSLQPLADQLASGWRGLLPGVHRLVFEGGRVLLTLCVGDAQPTLRALRRFDADSIFLDGFSPATNPRMWSPETLKAVARFARVGTGVASWTVARPVRDALAALGFQLFKRPGLPPKRDRLEGRFAPAWTVRRTDLWAAEIAATPGHCAVVGAGLAGAAVAASLALRGWDVLVLDAGAEAAAGASGLPVGVLAPHVSSDDAPLSRLTRAGVDATRQALAHRLEPGVDWGASGVLECRAAPGPRFPPGWSPHGPNESWQAEAERLAAAGRPAAAGIWHERGAWVRPGRLVRAWLAQPGVRFRGGAAVAAIEPAAPHEGEPARCWRLVDAAGSTLAIADRVVIAAGHASRHFAPGQPLQPVRGQLAWGRMPSDADPSAFPPFPVNGDGQFVGGVPDAAGPLWLAGATYARGCEDATPTPSDMALNRAGLECLLPAAGRSLAAAFDRGDAQAWAGIRGVSSDRRPMVGPIDPDAPAGPWLCTAMGSRGLSFAALCAELLAARWHGEPLPLPTSLADSLDANRHRGRRENRA